MDYYQFLVVIYSFITALTVVNGSVNTCRLPQVKHTNQSSSFSSSSTSVKAVDGCTDQLYSKGCCSHTGGGTEAWWQIDLEGLIILDYVQIFYRVEGYAQKQRFGGFQIYQSNTSDWRNSHRCYQDTTPTAADLSFTRNIPCRGSAQYLTIYSDRRSKALSWYSTIAYLELCEVEVYGCPFGYYGNGNCDSECGAGCVDSLCDPVTGECTLCIDGYYTTGSFCEKCPSNCLNYICQKESGVCFECNPGYYGRFCHQKCLFNCKDNKCLQSSGECEDCEDRFFGPSCDPCYLGCTSPLCNKESGACSPCKPGYFGDTCNASCQPNCKKDICNQTNGLCKECTVGFHGILCDLSCPPNCKARLCHQTTGRCIGCETKYYGSSCSLSCPRNCKDDTCMQENGHCLECGPGFYGSKCLDRCGYCQDGRCDKDTGNCLTSCIDGLTGIRCDIKVVVVNEVDKTAVIGIGSGCGVVFVVMAILIIVLVRRQRSGRQRNTTRSTTMTDISIPSIGKELRTETDNPYEVIDGQKREGNAMNEYLADDTYERLGQRDVEVPHIYENQ